VKTNATIVSVTQTEGLPPRWLILVDLDAGGHTQAELSAPDVVRLMAAARSSTVHFPGGRCKVDGESLVFVEPKTPYPIAG
jgi:hypothetical protein